MRYRVECLGQSAFILEFYIAFDIILICLTGGCSANKLKLRDPSKVTRESPQYDSSGFLPIHQGYVDECVFQTPDGIRFAKDVGLEFGFI